MIKEALQYLVGMDKNELVEINCQTYTTKKLNHVSDIVKESLKTNTLNSIIDYVKSNFDKISEKLIIHVSNHETVIVRSPLKFDGSRDLLMAAQSKTPHIEFERFLDTENFNIMMQSAFVQNEDSAQILKVIGTIKEENIRETGDDGVSQQVTAKTGIATVGNVKVPNPVSLIPYRTFQEIEQVESKFIFRMKNGPVAAIFEADGGAWKLETMMRIKAYLEEQLQEYKDKVEIIA